VIRGVQNYGVDLGALALALRSPDSLSRRNLVVNENLLDVRGWSKLPAPEIERRLAGDPLAVLAAWELADAAAALAAGHQSEAEFLRPFANPDFTERMVFLHLGDPPEQLPLWNKVIVSARSGEWDGLLFLQHVVRWARRFAHFKSGDLREFRRINYQYPFCVAVVDRGVAGREALVYDVLEDLGLVVHRVDPDQLKPDQWAGAGELLGLSLRKTGAKQKQLELREAGGTVNSIFAVRAMGGVDGYEVRGDFGPDLGLIIDIGDREINAASTAYIEQHVIRVINETTSLSAEIDEGSLRLCWFDTALSEQDLAQTIHEALKSAFILSTVSVNMIFDPLRISSLKASVLSYIEHRDTQLDRRSEEGEPFVICTACKRYAPHAFCIASADRDPCCGRSYDELAVLAQLTRGSDQRTIKKGICTNRRKGAYVGVDKAASQNSDGAIRVIHLHSMEDRPHPTTAIPRCVAWVMDDLDTIGVMSRDYPGRSPDGKTFDSLLARVAGRQTPGFVGVSEQYILSPKFFSDDGGLSRICWMNSTLKKGLGLRAEHIATEDDCTSVAALREFLSSWRR
jgi:hypothetical protein